MAYFVSSSQNDNNNNNNNNDDDDDNKNKENCYIQKNLKNSYWRQLFQTLLSMKSAHVDKQLHCKLI